MAGWLAFTHKDVFLLVIWQLRLKLTFYMKARQPAMPFLEKNWLGVGWCLYLSWKCAQCVHFQLTYRQQLRPRDLYGFSGFGFCSRSASHGVYMHRVNARKLAASHVKTLCMKTRQPAMPFTCIGSISGKNEQFLEKNWSVPDIYCLSTNFGQIWAFSEKFWGNFLEKMMKLGKSLPFLARRALSEGQSQIFTVYRPIFGEK